jgi:3-phosphoglycerate kinase
MAFTFLASLGYNIGNSILDKDSIDYCKNLINKYKDKIVLPIDVVVNSSIDGNNLKTVSISDIKDDMIGLDIGKLTVAKWREVILNSKDIIWNGPLGYVENDMYIDGTKGVCASLDESSAKVIVGGGDTGAIVRKLGYGEKFYISTGGGATLEMLEGKVLPGIDIIKDRKSL